MSSDHVLSGLFAQMLVASLLLASRSVGGEVTEPRIERPCPPAQSYGELSMTVPGLAERAACFSVEPPLLLLLWTVGCPPCIHEFRDTVFPAVQKNPKLAHRVLTVFLVDDLNSSQYQVSFAAKTLRRLAGHQELRHLVVERGDSEIWRALEKHLEERPVLQYPAFLFFDSQSERFLSLGDEVESEESHSSSDTYFEAVKEVLGGLQELEEGR